jgi:hypothetical protein
MSQINKPLAARVVIDSDTEPPECERRRLAFGEQQDWVQLKRKTATLDL